MGRLIATMAIKAATLVLAATALAGCAHPEDGLEENDTAAEATLVEPGEALEGTVNEDDPDFFQVDAPHGRILRFDLTSRGREECPFFTLTEPGGRVMFDSGSGVCSSIEPEPEIQVPELSYQHTDVDIKAYSFVIDETIEGTYVLRISERGQSDNLAPFGWDYTLTASVDG